MPDKQTKLHHIICVICYTSLKQKEKKNIKKKFKFPQLITDLDSKQSYRIKQLQIIQLRLLYAEMVFNEKSMKQHFYK